MTASTPSYTILVGGATGNTGGHTARALARLGHKVRALVRDPASEKAQALAAVENVEVVKGDYLDRASLDAAFEGVQRAFVVNFFGSPTHALGEISFLAAAKAHGVELTVRISTCQPLIGRDAPIKYARAHHAIEGFIATGEGGAVADLNPDWFLENLYLFADEAKQTGAVTLPIADLDAKSPQMSTAQIGEAAARLLTIDAARIPTYAGRRFNLGGARPVSFREIYALIAKAAGRAIEVRSVSHDEFVAKLQKNLGLDETLASSFSRTFQIMAGERKGYAPIAQATDAEILALFTPAADDVEKTAEAIGAAYA